MGSFERSHTIARKVYLRLLFARNAKKPNNTEKLGRKNDRWDGFLEEHFGLLTSTGQHSLPIPKLLADMEGVSINGDP